MVRRIRGGFWGSIDARAGRAASIVALATCGTLGIVPACSTPYGERERSDAGPSGQPDVGVPADPCNHAHPIAAPDSDDDPSTEIPPFILAFDDITLDRTDLGYDIDNVCSCDERPNTAFAGAQSCVRKNPSCDREGGVDNVFADVVKGYAGFGSFEDLTQITARATQGRQTVLLYVRRYNGRANDRDVEVGVISSDGNRTGGCPDSELGSRGFYPPKWCGDDEWTTQPGTTLADGSPLSLAPGYVRDYNFVVSLPGTARVGVGPVSLELGTPIISGKLVPLGEDMTPRPLDRPPTEREKRLYRVESGQLAGRMSVGSLLGAIGSIDIPGSDDKDGGADADDHICKSVLFVQIRKEICEAVDVARTPSLDFQSVACDALSTAIGFTAGPAKLGITYAADHAANDCLPVDGAPTKPSEYAPSYSCPTPDGGE